MSTISISFRRRSFPGLIKVVALLLCFILSFEQSGLAQELDQLDLSGRIANATNSFSTVFPRMPQLRYISYDKINQSFKIILNQGDANRFQDVNSLDSAREPLKFFYIGLSIPNESMWVNLKQDSPDEIVDDDLAKTDVGKILLEADLELKKDLARFTFPSTPEGKEYWDNIYKKIEEVYGPSNAPISLSTRIWITPGEVIICQDQNSAYIYKAGLNVSTEAAYLKNKHGNRIQDQQARTMNDYSSGLMQKLILPKISKEVNTGKKYASLRQVYYSLILAQWFKRKFYGAGGLYSYLIDRKNLTGLTSSNQWSKDAYFKEYQKSYIEKEYDLQVQVFNLFGSSVRTYASGGVDFAGIFTGVNPAQIKVISISSFSPPLTGQANLLEVDNHSCSLEEPYFGRDPSATPLPDAILQPPIIVHSNNIKEIEKVEALKPAVTKKEFLPIIGFFGTLSMVIITTILLPFLPFIAWSGMETMDRVISSPWGPLGLLIKHKPDSRNHKEPKVLDLETKDNSKVFVPASSESLEDKDMEWALNDSYKVPKPEITGVSKEETELLKNLEVVIDTDMTDAQIQAALNVLIHYSPGENDYERVRAIARHIHPDEFKKLIRVASQNQPFSDNQLLQEKLASIALERPSELSVGLVRAMSKIHDWEEVLKKPDLAPEDISKISECCERIVDLMPLHLTQEANDSIGSIYKTTKQVHNLIEKSIQRLISQKVSNKAEYMESVSQLLKRGHYFSDYFGALSYFSALNIPKGYVYNFNNGNNGNGKANHKVKYSIWHVLIAAPAMARNAISNLKKLMPLLNTEGNEFTPEEHYALLKPTRIGPSDSWLLRKPVSIVLSFLLGMLSVTTLILNGNFSIGSLFTSSIGFLTIPIVHYVFAIIGWISTKREINKCHRRIKVLEKSWDVYSPPSNPPSNQVVKLESGGELSVGSLSELKEPVSSNPVEADHDAKEPLKVVQDKEQGSVNNVMAQSATAIPQSNTPGGIDFRATNFTRRNMASTTAENNEPAIKKSILSDEVEQDLAGITRLIKAKIIPSSDRLRECLNKIPPTDQNKYRQQINNCVTEILMLEEEYSQPSEPFLVDLLQTTALN